MNPSLASIINVKLLFSNVSPLLVGLIHPTRGMGPSVPLSIHVESKLVSSFVVYEYY